MTSQERETLPIGGIIAGALPFIGVLGDFRPHPDPQRLVTEYAVRSYERRVAASWSRWVGLVLTVLILGWTAAANPLLAPLAVIIWLLLVNRLVWRHGANPSPRAALEGAHLVWWTLSFALVAVAASLADLLFPAPWWAGTATVTAALALVLALSGAFPTAKAVIAAQVPEAPDMTAYAIIQGIFGITDVALGKYIESGALEARFDGGMLTAKIPVGPDALLEKRSDLDARVALKAAEWQVAFADAATDVLVLEPVDEATQAQRDAVQRSGGLFAEALGGGLDELETIDLGLTAESLPRL